MANQEPTKEQLKQRKSVLNSANTNLALVIDQVSSIGSKDYEHIVDALQDAKELLNEVATA